MHDTIEILDVDLLHKHPETLEFIDYWKAALGRVIGWHYDLDIIWILDNIKRLGLKKGATILDAGAGNGLMQFLLAAKGFNVISADFAERDIPWAAGKIFNISSNNSSLAQMSDHRYRRFIQHTIKMDSARLTRVLGTPLRSIRRIFENTRDALHPKRWREIWRQNEYGHIEYLTTDFTKLDSIAANSVDCVVSVSAIEHGDQNSSTLAIKEFERVLKKGGANIITTSATNGPDKYLEYCQGWCFSRDTLAAIFSAPGISDNFADYEALFNKLLNDSTFRSRIPTFYYEGGDNGLPYGKYPPQYQPVGIRKVVG